MNKEDVIEYDVDKKMLRQYATKLINELKSERPCITLMEVWRDIISCRIDDLIKLAKKQNGGENE